MKFYTYAKSFGGKILFRGFTNGRRQTQKEEFKPSLFIRSNKKDTEWKSLFGDNVEEVNFPSIKEAKDFIKTYDGVASFPIFGDIGPEYQFLTKEFPGDISYDVSKMSIKFIDIETVDVAAGASKFPNIQLADVPIVLISYMDRATQRLIVFGTKHYDKEPGDNFEFRLSRDENTMLREFITVWASDYPDIVTGWNTEGFDFPYLINRITRILDLDYAKRLSPFGLLQERTFEIRGKDVQTYDILGVVHLDYLALYKKFGTYSQKESYALGAIAEEEIGEKKLENPGKNFWDFYVNFYDTFVKYNAKDSELVYKLDQSLQLIELAISIAYVVKCNISDVFGPVKTWDVFIYNHLHQQKIAIPPAERKHGGEFEGAWVKDPQIGMHGWTMSFDFASLYPTIIRQWNISPETLVRDMSLPLRADDLLSQEQPGRLENMFWPQYIKDNDYTLAANGSMYRKDKKGVLPELMEFLMVGRKKAKKEMLLLEQEYQQIQTEIDRRNNENNK